MSVSTRQKQILEMLNCQHFLTVEDLAEALYISPSSIRRDLTDLQNQGFVRRTHGGVSLMEEERGPIPLNTRMTQNTAAKRKIARRAASLLSDGITVMLDGSSTTGYLVPHLAKFRDITLFTNNMLTAINAINHGIRTHCIGGIAINQSPVLSGRQAYEAAQQIHPDLFFFSTQSLAVDGTITDPQEEENYMRGIMIEQAKKSVYLCDSGKFNRKSLYYVTSLDRIHAAVFDIEWKELKADCEILF